MSVTSEIDLSAGAYVKGVRLSETTFLAATSFKQLRTFTRDPDLLQPGSKRGADDPSIEDERAIHELIQRALAGNKKSNVPSYTQYIEKVVRGDGPGVLPPMHLWSPDSLEVVSVGATTYLLVPNGEHLLAIDGETQLTAHHAVGRKAALDSSTRKAHLDFPLGAVIHHGILVSSARQYFHDLNILAVRPNTSLGLSMDTQDPLMQIVNNLELNIPLLAGRVEKMTRQLAKSSPKIVTLQSLRQMVVNVLRGIGGIQYGSKPVPIDGVDLAQLDFVASGWIRAFLETFEVEIVNRERTLAGSGPVLAAVGAMGNELMGLHPVQLEIAQNKLLDRLRQIDWSKNRAWVGVAGHYTSRGVFSVKGTKEVAYAVFAALSDPESAAYPQIRFHGQDNEPFSPDIR